MNTQSPNLILSTSPFVKRPRDTPYVMRHVIYALLPAVGAAIYYFGLSAALVIAACVVGSTLTELLFDLKAPESTTRDGSAILTGLLLALTLPPGLPLWMAFLGGVVSIAVGKLIFGGLGQNIFNPSLVGRAFLQASFPVALTTWVGHGGLSEIVSLRGTPFTIPLLSPEVDALSAATPLAQMKFDQQLTPALDLLIGNTAGSLGETFAIGLLLGGLYLAARKFLNWRIPLSIFLSVAAFATALWLVDPEIYGPPQFHLLSGGLMLGALYMATDPVTSPLTPRGCWVFGAGIGILVVAIRTFGGLPEGVMYAILLMNAAVPLINRFTQPRVYGT